MRLGQPSTVHSSTTFKPYDPNRALGDLSPTAPKMPRNAFSLLKLSIRRAELESVCPMPVMLLVRGLAAAMRKC